MRIKLDALDRERFHVDKRELEDVGEVYLITPNEAFFGWAEEELHLRSLLCLPDGQVVSAGFPKFYNYGENKASDAISEEALASQHLAWTPKVDGSLIIRSVINGKVHFRTRGNHTLGEFTEPVLKLIQDKYPILLDPTLTARGRDESWLFEYVGPANQIVVRYEEPELIALARIDFSGDYLKVDDADLWCHLGMKTLEAQQLDTFTPASIKDMLLSLQGQEGFVAWCRTPKGFHLSKWKTAWYLRLHGLRSKASPRFVKEYCIQHSANSLEEFAQALQKDGFDWETVKYLEPMYQEYITVAREVKRLAAEYEKQLQDQEVFSLPTRKDKALACRQIADDLGASWLFGMGIMLVTGEAEKAALVVPAQILGIGSNAYAALKKTWK